MKSSSYEFIWILVSETAINIGYSCKLLTDEMEEIYIVDGESYDEVLEQLTKVGPAFLSGKIGNIWIRL